jgi:hypothetical protein
VIENREVEDVGANDLQDEENELLVAAQMRGIEKRLFIMDHVLPHRQQQMQM